jgi:hypothetical protein
MPFAWIRAAALLCEIGSLLLGTRAWLTRDFVTIGREPYWGDTARMRRELLPVLRHPSLEDGIETLR